MDKQTKNQIGVTGLIILIILLTIYLVHLINHPSKFVFISNGNETDSALTCEKNWHYEKVEFISCFNGELLTIYNNSLNFSLSPETNCKLKNANFIGLNQTDYSEIMPKCFNLDSNNINEQFLKEIECIRGNKKRCEEWKTDGLIIKRNWWWF